MTENTAENLENEAVAGDEAASSESTSVVEGDATVENGTEEADTTEASADHGFPTEDEPATPEATEEASETEGASDENEADTEEETAPVTFADRAAAMGLTAIGDGGCFHYADTKSEVTYRNLFTGLEGPGADLQIPHLAIFTKAAGLDGDFVYIGMISDQYKFQGNDALIDSIKASLESVGSPVFREETIMSPNLAQMRHELLVQNATNVPSVGDIFPVMLIRNSYDGTKAADITFGLFFTEGENEDVIFGARQKLGHLRQVHIEHAGTEMAGVAGEYVNVFASNIADLVQANFDTHLTEDDMLKTLDLIEAKTGKRRRDAISELMTSDAEGIESWSMTAWQLFNAIAKFSTVEKNLNAKLIMEDIAERVLVVPGTMIEALAAMNQ